MQLEMDRMHNSHAAHVREIEDAHRMHVSEVKKKQWVSLYNEYKLIFPLRLHNLKIYLI